MRFHKHPRSDQLLLLLFPSRHFLLGSPPVAVLINLKSPRDGEKKNANVPHAVKPVGEQVKTPANAVVKDPLGDARSKVQEEITREFAAIMATGTLRASEEAAALATKKVMQRY
ncbi:hypothetical protein RDI58_006102 [Solanum bulbocastanum]|uniref:Uncharacterized protein n=1 Tax=Solanum bulbocastanum TaxID=147425 RepID=A0AAN8YN32_SOLBU